MEKEREKHKDADEREGNNVRGTAEAGICANPADTHHVQVDKGEWVARVGVVRSAGDGPKGTVGRLLAAIVGHAEEKRDGQASHFEIRTRYFQETIFWSDRVVM